MFHGLPWHGLAFHGMVLHYILSLYCHDIAITSSSCGHGTALHTNTWFCSIPRWNLHVHTIMLCYNAWYHNTLRHVTSLCIMCNIMHLISYQYYIHMTYIYIYTHVYTVYMCVYIYIYILYTYVCICIHTYIYIYILRICDGCSTTSYIVNVRGIHMGIL